jgi:tetratricopeptide (TPR) repeat protein
LDDMLTWLRMQRAAGTRVYCLVGAGMSIDAGLPSWNCLAEQLNAFVDGRRPPAFGHEHARSSDTGSLLEAGQRFRDARITYDVKQAEFDRIFLDKRVPLPIHYALVRFGFDAVVTTNFDRLLEDAYSAVYRKTPRVYLPDDFKKSLLILPHSFFIGKLHGDAGNWDTAVLGTMDYKLAGWIPKMIQLLEGSILVVIGAGGKDPLVNALIEQLPENVQVVVFLPPDECTESQNTRFHNLRDNVTFVPAERDAIAPAIVRTDSKRGERCIAECSWGTMPMVPLSVVGASSTERDVLSLLKVSKSVCITGGASFGTSSLLSGLLHRVRDQLDAHVVRLEAKEWLPIDVYSLALVAEMPEPVRAAYSRLRDSRFLDWNAAEDGDALGEAIGHSPVQIVLAIEHIGRCALEMETFLARVLRKSTPTFRLLLVDTGTASPTLERFDTSRFLRQTNTERITASEPTQSFYREVLSEYLPESTFEQGIPNGTSLCALVLSAAVKQLSVAERFELNELLVSRSLFELCQLVVERLSPLERQVLSVSAHFHAYRSQAAIAACVDESPEKVSVAISHLMRLGLLRPAVSSVTSYSMSTTLRSVVLRCLSRHNSISLRIAKYHESAVLAELGRSEGQNPEMFSTILPLACAALTYYREASARCDYMKLVYTMTDRAIQMYHPSVLDAWLAFAPLSIVDDADTELRRCLVQAKLDKTRARLSEYNGRVNLARTLVCKTEDPELQTTYAWETSVLATMAQRYREALEGFEAIKEKYSAAPKSRWFLNSWLRTVQTRLSLGELEEAGRNLERIDRVLKADRTPLRLHECAMHARHSSTLSILRLLLGVTNNHDEEFNNATSKARECLNLWRELGNKTGVGIAQLKLAQAALAASRYEVATSEATHAASVLAAYPDHRGWRMSAHEVAARSLACGGHREGAKRELEIAQKLFDAAGRDDRLREAELICTRGIVSLQVGDVHDAVKYLRASLDGVDANLPIGYQHRLWFASALIRSGDALQAEDQLHAANQMFSRVQDSFIGISQPAPMDGNSGNGKPRRVSKRPRAQRGIET